MDGVRLGRPIALGVAVAGRRRFMGGADAGTLSASPSSLHTLGTLILGIEVVPSRAALLPLDCVFGRIAGLAASAAVLSPAGRASMTGCTWRGGSAALAGRITGSAGRVAAGGCSRSSVDKSGERQSSWHCMGSELPGLGTCAAPKLVAGLWCRGRVTEGIACCWRVVPGDVAFASGRNGMHWMAVVSLPESSNRGLWEVASS